jgi:hypothetical protein
MTETTPKPEMGTLIHGTMRPEDLLPAFLAECDRLAVTVSTETRAIAKAMADPDAVALQSAADEALEVFFDALSGVAPFGCYFGAHVGDGSDYGYWLSEAWCDALGEHCIDESNWEAVLGICEDEGIDSDDFADAWRGEVSAYSDSQAGAAYAKESAEECGMVDDDAKWPHNCIDWDEAWRQLSFDGYSVHRIAFGRWAIILAV